MSERRKFTCFAVSVLFSALLLSCTQESVRDPDPSTSKSEIQLQQFPLEKGVGLSQEERSEIRETLNRIAGRERRYRQDGSIFQNREKRLPLRPQGYYKEYTVETPGARNRGARRLVIGKDHDIYYTKDHYRTFVKIDPEDYN